LLAVPIEVVGIAGCQLSLLDMPRSEFVAATAWQGQDAQSSRAAVAALSRRHPRSRLGEADNFLLFADLLSMRRK
jgi:hypothetical protein